MKKTTWGFALGALTASVSLTGQVQSVGDVSFAVPAGWTYQQAAGSGTMAFKAGNNFWGMAVYPSMRSTGDPTRDLQTAWQRIVLSSGQYQGFPLLPYPDIAHSVGYGGKRADASSVNRATYSRLYVLETGAAFIPVLAMSNDGMVLNSQEHVANAVLGSVRLAPLRAAPIQTSLTIADLAGDWKSGLASSIDYHDRSSGQYQSTSNSFVGAAYHIEPNGTFTYKMGGVINNNRASDSDSGVVELGGELITFKGRNHVVRYRFLNLQHAIDGSAVLTLLPPGELAHINIVRDSEYWSRRN